MTITVISPHRGLLRELAIMASTVIEKDPQTAIEIHICKEETQEGETNG